MLLDVDLEVEEVNDGANRYVQDIALEAFSDRTIFLLVFLFLVHLHKDNVDIQDNALKEASGIWRVAFHRELLASNEEVEDTYT